MALTLTSYADVQKHLNDLLTANGQLNDTNHAPHKDWWNSMTYEQFVSGSVPGVADPNTGQHMPILAKGDAAQSNIILALQGAAGTVFDNNSGAIGQMPADGPPFFTQEQIQPLIDWINAGCPNGGLPAEPVET